jgi:putative ABC transport system substrate-binding protein
MYGSHHHQPQNHDRDDEHDPFFVVEKPSMMHAIHGQPPSGAGPPAFEALKGRADALYVCIDALVNANRIRINTSALGARLPTMHGSRDYVEAGGLMSYGPNYPDLFRRAADYVDKILHGAKPGDIPVEQPTKFDLVINVTTAKALGLDVPPTLLARADEVIE